LTRYLDDPRLTPVTPEFCREIIGDVSEMQHDLRQRLGTTFAFLGDEIYLKAGQAIPPRKHYGDYPQIEDGIGMVRSFANDFEKVMRTVSMCSLKGGLVRPAGAQVRPLNEGKAHLRGTILTGTLFAPVLREMMERFNNRSGSEVVVAPVVNDYFGGDVSVAGLLTGGDFAAARAQVRGDFVIIPRVSLKSDEPIFLDGLRFEELKGEFDVPVHAFDFDQLASFLQTNLAACQQ